MQEKQNYRVFEEIYRRLKLLEERYNELDRKTEVIETNMLSNIKKLNTEIKTLNNELLEIKRNLTKIEDNILLIIKELKLTAKKEELETLKKYLDLWQPVKFATIDFVEKRLNELRG